MRGQVGRDHAGDQAALRVHVSCARAPGAPSEWPVALSNPLPLPPVLQITSFFGAVVPGSGKRTLMAVRACVGGAFVTVLLRRWR